MRSWFHLTGAGLLVLLLSPGAASAQYLKIVPDTPTFEVGGQVLFLQFTQFGTVPRETNIAGGFRFTFNLTDWFALENQTDFYPHDTFLPGLMTVQSVFGIKAGARGRWGGIFGTFRPGFMVHGQDWACGPHDHCDNWHNDYHDYHDHQEVWWFAANAGAAAELYPSRGFMVRFDVGDMFVQRWDHVDASGHRLYFSSHNLQASFGMAARF